MGIIQQVASKVKGVSDIIFCIDKSGSMTSCIEGVKNNITTFVNSIEKNSPNSIIDWQLGFCAYDDMSFDVLNLVDDTSKFSNSLALVQTGGNEFTAGAIDYCISGMKWRKISNKFLLLFTDEPLEGGDKIEESKSKFNDLLKKIVSNHIYLYFYGPKCPYYNQFSQLSKADAVFLESDNFNNLDFKNIMGNLGKTVSLSSNSDSTEENLEKTFLFDLSKMQINIL